MMGEIIDHGYPTLFTFHFAAASHVLKATQSLTDDVALNAPRVGRDYYCQTVEQIELAHQRRLESPPIGAFARNGKTTEVRRSEEHTSELQSQSNLVCRLLLEKKKK